MLINLNFSQFFSSVQESPWYLEFLTPVVEMVAEKSHVLDIGTGSGKLLQLLVKEKFADCTGTDTSKAMLDEAAKKLEGTGAVLLQIAAGAKFPFQHGRFDCICICSVLFNLKTEVRDQLLHQCLNVLQTKGKIIILSPSGEGNYRTFMTKFIKRHNKSFGLWYILTRSSAIKWGRDKYLQGFCEINKLKYSHKLVFDGYALLEIMERS